MTQPVTVDPWTWYQPPGEDESGQGPPEAL